MLTRRLGVLLVLAVFGLGLWGCSKTPEKSTEGAGSGPGTALKPMGGAQGGTSKSKIGAVSD